MSKKRADTTIKIGNRDINLSDALPVTLGDMIDLEEQGIALGSFEPTAKNIMTVLAHFAHKIDAEITVEQLRALPDADVGRAFASIIQNEQRADPNA